VKKRFENVPFKCNNLHRYAEEVCCSNPAAQVIYAALKPGTPASSEALAEAWKGPDGGARCTLTPPDPQLKGAW
jgi:hypothetical protein